MSCLLEGTSVPVSYTHLKLRVRGAGSGKIRRQDPGRTRGDPSDRHYTDAGTGKRTAFQRPVPSVPAYLEALHGEPDAPGGLRDNLRQGSSRRGAFYPVGVDVYKRQG